MCHKINSLIRCNNIVIHIIYNVKLFYSCFYRPNRDGKDDYSAPEELPDIRFQIDHMHSASSFMYGFKLGTMIMIEVLAGEGELVKGN
ncbi:DUF6809 family protein [Lutispora saccharofermentans]|uniref:DUF6809 family protein n=1 Tax=Lutispora saccharofermentans TaxID=3024236 RepID=UPI0038CC0DCE